MSRRTYTLPCVGSEIASHWKAEKKAEPIQLSLRLYVCATAHEGALIIAATTKSRREDTMRISEEIEE